MIDSPYTLGFQRMQLLTAKQKAAIHLKFIDLPQDEVYKATEDYLANLSEQAFQSIKPLTFSCKADYYRNSESAYMEVREIRKPNEDSSKDEIQEFEDHFEFNKGEVDLHNEIDIAMFGNARITQTIYAPGSTTTAFKSTSIEIAFGELEKVYLEAKKRREKELALLDYYN